MARNEIWVLVWMYLVSTTAEGPRCPPGAADDQCREDSSAADDYFFYVNGAKLRLVYGPTYYHFICLDNVTLEYEWLPRFERAVNVSKATLTECAPPSCGYAAALRALGVAPRSLVLAGLPARAALAADQLRGLALRELDLAGDAPLRVDPALFEPLAGLSVLSLTNVSLTREAALLLPTALRSLSLTGVGVAVLPAEAFGRLPALMRLVLRDPLVYELDLREALALRLVSIYAPLSGVTLGPSVVNVALRGVRGVALLGNCSSLRTVAVDGSEEPPPARWLAACPALRELAVSRCRLRELPPQWLADAPALEALDLSDNELRRLPGELAGARALRRVRLAGNRLEPAALDVLAELPALRELSLDRNPLGDLCGSGDVVTNGLSPLWRARGLRSLSLMRTNVSRVCRDWRTDLLQLAALDLRYNRIPLLQFDDLQWQRAAAARVDLRHNPLSDVHYSREQFQAVLAGNLSAEFASSPLTTLVLDPVLRCECGSYWYVRAVQERPQHARAALKGARCGERGPALEAVDPRNLTCALPQAHGCPAGCSCHISGEHSQLACERAGLRRVPRAPLGLPARVLRLAHNNITDVTLDDFSPDLEILDLSDNLVSSVDAATAAALFGAGRSVRLDGNPLRCDCDALPLLRALRLDAARRPGRQGRPGWPGRQGTTCRGEELERACATVLWPYALAALALAAASAVAAGCLVRPAARQRFKKFLLERGLCLRWVLRPLREDDDAERPYDAFVSFSHHDERFAAELARRLERGAARRLCLHQRDWRPGDWIPAQIARSVRLSRRTLVLLSERFLQSAWARAELREAYGAALRSSRPRLLLVLLPGLSTERAAAADPTLRAYLASVTYLRWDDPLFWDKLLLALPKPRATGAAGVRATPLPLPPLAAPAPPPCA